MTKLANQAAIEALLMIYEQEVAAATGDDIIGQSSSINLYHPDPETVVVLISTGSVSYKLSYSGDYRIMVKKYD